MSGTQEFDAERTILGASLLDVGAWHSAADIIRAEDFKSRANQDVWRSIAELVGRGETVDLVSVKNELTRQGKVDKGTVQYLASLVDQLPRIANVESWARIVRSNALASRVGVLGQKIQAEAARGADGNELVDRAMKALLALSIDRGEERLIGTPEALLEVAKYADTLASAQGGIVGARTGVVALDAITGGLQRGDLVIVAARPSQGKTALAIKTADAVAAEGGVALVFSLEMTRMQVTLRRVCAAGDCDKSMFARGEENARESWRRFSLGVEKLQKHRVVVDDSRVLTPTQVRARARKVLAQEGRLDLVVVDYMQLLSWDKRTDSREREVALISKNLKAIAGDLGCPLIAVSQLNRLAEDRKDRRPELRDLRESGAIEQDADTVVLVHQVGRFREEMRGHAELIVAKQRNGPTATAHCVFIDEYADFRDVALGR